MKKKSLKITFVLPFVNLTGGIKILFEHANRLVERGHKVMIVYPGVLFHGNNYETANNSAKWKFSEAPLRSLKYWFFVTLLRKTEANWFPLDCRITLKRSPDLSARYIPDADIVIATANETADYVATYPETKGIKIYFVQGYETMSREAHCLHRTFQYKMHIVAVSQSLGKRLREKSGITPEIIIPNGIDVSVFRPKDKAALHNPPRLLMINHHQANKGVADGLAAYSMVKKAGYPITLVMFGQTKLENDDPTIEYHFDPPQAQLPDLYRSCDIFLWSSHEEGFGLPPLEAMASGSPVVGTDTGAMREYMKDGITGYIVPPKQPKLLAEKLIGLLNNPDLIAKMGRAGAKEAKKWEWGKQTKKLERYLLSLV